MLVAHLAPALVGARIGTLLAGRSARVVAVIVAAATLLGCVGSSFLIPVPAWFLVIQGLLFLPSAWLGGRLVLGPTVSPVQDLQHGVAE